MSYTVAISAEGEARVQQIHRDIKIFDNLATHCIDADYIKLLKQVGINTVHYTVAFTSLKNRQNLEDNFVTACEKIGHWYRILDENKADIELATSLASMEDIWSRGKIAVFFGFQNGSPLEDNLDYLTLFYKMGIRFIMLTYNKRNFIGSGAGETHDTGLSDFGIEVVRKMNELGICVDLSHCGEKTSFDAIDVSQKPCILTHANPRSLAPVRRNKSDELVKFCVEKGGLVGPKHMIGNMVNKLAEDTTVEDYVDMIDHYVQLVGIDHVIIGTDFCGTVHGLSDAAAQIEMIRALAPDAYVGKRASPQGFARIDGLFNVTRSLVNRGYSDADIEKIYSGNVRRVLKTIFNEE